MWYLLWSKIRNKFYDKILAEEGDANRSDKNMDDDVKGDRFGGARFFKTLRKAARD